MDEQDIQEDARFTLKDDSFTAHSGMFSESGVYENGERVRELDTEMTSIFPIIVFSDGEFSEDDAVVEEMNARARQAAEELANAYEEAEDKEEYLRSADIPRLVEEP